jgi:hypothetical protein
MTRRGGSVQPPMQEPPLVKVAAEADPSRSGIQVSRGGRDPNCGPARSGGAGMARQGGESGRLAYPGFESRAPAPRAWQMRLSYIRSNQLAANRP